MKSFTTTMLADGTVICIQDEPFIYTMTTAILGKYGAFNSEKGILINKFLHKAIFCDLQWCKDDNWFMGYDPIKEEWVINIREAYLDYLTNSKKIVNFDEKKLMLFLLRNCDSFDVAIENPITKIHYKGYKEKAAMRFVLSDTIYAAITNIDRLILTYNQEVRLIISIYDYVNRGNLIKTDKPFMVFISGWNKPLDIGYMNDELRDYISWKLVIDGPKEDNHDIIFNTLIKNVPKDYILDHLNEYIMTYQDDSIKTKIARLLNIDKNGQELANIMDDIPRNYMSTDYLMVFRYLYKQLGLNYIKLDNTNLLFVTNTDTKILLLNNGVVVDSCMNPYKDIVYKLSYIHLRRALEANISVYYTHLPSPRDS